MTPNVNFLPGIPFVAVNTYRILISRAYTNKRHNIKDISTLYTM